MSKITIELVHKIDLLPNITCLIFQSQDIFKFEPGQFLAIEVSPGVHRSYSLFYCDHKAPAYYTANLKDLEAGKYIGLMINTKPDGVGSYWAKNIELKQVFPAIGCNGSFVVQRSLYPKVFVATSTGIAPFIPMIKSVITSDMNQTIMIYFGALSPSDDFSDSFLGQLASNPNVKVYKCFDNIDPDLTNQTNNLGRVTKVIQATMTRHQMQGSDFYLCGNPMMVEATAKLLEENQVQNVYYEKY